MSTITLNDLKQQSGDDWLKSLGQDVIVTSQGQPVAVLFPINAASVDATLSTLRSLRALQAQVEVQQAAEANGTAELSAAEIDAEIKAARDTRRQK